MNQRSTADEILQQCLADVAAGRRTPAECAAAYPEWPDLRAELEAAQVLGAFSALGSARPSAAANRRNEARLRAALAAQTNRQPAVAWWPRWATAVALATVLAVGGLGVTAASAGSLPGHALYPIKRVTENVRGLLTPASEQAAWHAQLANERTEELLALAAQPSTEPALMNRAAADLASETNAALASVAGADSDDQAALLETIIEQIDDQEAALTTAQAGQSDNPAVDEALAETRANRTEAQEQLSVVQGNGAPAGTIPTAMATSSPTGTVSPTATILATATATRTTPPTATDRPSNTPRPTTLPPGQASKTVTAVLPTATDRPTNVPPGQEKKTPTVTPTSPATNTSAPNTPVPSATATPSPGNNGNGPNCNANGPNSPNYCTPTPGGQGGGNPSDSPTPTPTELGGGGGGQPNCNAQSPASPNYCTPTPGPTDEGGGGGGSGGGHQPNCNAQNPSSQNYCTPTPAGQRRPIQIG